LRSRARALVRTRVGPIRMSRELGWTGVIGHS
jgi:hypothetical protein